MFHCDWSVAGRLMRQMSLTRTHHATVVGPIRFSNRSNNCRIYKINGRQLSLVRTHHATIVFSSSLRPTDDKNRMVCAGLYKTGHSTLSLKRSSDSTDDVFHRVAWFPCTETSSIFIPRVNHAYAQKHIRHNLIQTINNTPNNIIDKIHTHSLRGFLNYIKVFIFGNYEDHCHVSNCYICKP